MFSDHNEIEQEINYREIKEKSQDSWKVKHTLNNPLVKEEVSRGISKYFIPNEI